MVTDRPQIIIIHNHRPKLISDPTGDFVKNDQMLISDTANYKMDMHAQLFMLKVRLQE